MAKIIPAAVIYLLCVIAFFALVGFSVKATLAFIAATWAGYAFSEVRQAFTEWSRSRSRDDHR